LIVYLLTDKMSVLPTTVTQINAVAKA